MINVEDSTIIRRRIRVVAAFTLLAWLGEFVHNLLELPQLTVLSPENNLPALVFLILFVAWWYLPTQRITAILMIIWALLHLVGGAIISVIPFSFLPFYPEQSLQHYLTHIFYGVAQLPLIIVLLQQFRNAG
jgi:hypothetical protein